MKNELKPCTFIVLVLSAALWLKADQPPQFATIYQFGGVNAIPSSELTLGPSGQIFGTTYGGADADGTGSIYELVPNGNGAFIFNTLYRFDTAYSPANDGQYPDAGLTLSPDGTTLYGTTQQGGSGGGVLFSLNIAQSEGKAVKPRFPQPKDNGLGYAIGQVFNVNSEGGFARATMTEGVAHGNIGLALAILIGTLSSDGPNNGGAVFSFDPTDQDVMMQHGFSGSGTEKAVFGFDPQGKLALGPSGGGSSGSVQKSLIKPNAATNIDLSTIAVYGIAKSGGSNNWGTVYSVTANGSNFMVLHHFNLSTTDGAGPMGGLVLSGNTLYGTTPLGGGNFAGTIFKINTDGSGFQIIENFDFATTGYSPEGDLILSGSTLYGTTHAGGVNGGGTVYSVNTSGSNFMVLHSFTTPVSDGNGHYTNSDGGLSVAGLLLSHYTLYGTTPYGGTNGVGTAYEILLPAPPSLSITKPAGSYAVVWPSSATNFVLQSNSTLNSLTWSNFTGTVHDDGTNKSIGIIPRTGKAFFRLLNTNGP